MLPYILPRSISLTSPVLISYQHLLAFSYFYHLYPILIGSNTYHDKELLLQIAEGDEKAFTALYHQYVPQLLPFVTGVVRSDAVADEIIQETFLRLWLGRDKLAAILEPRAWIFRIASHICYTHLKRTLREKDIVSRLAAGSQQQEADVHVQAQASELAALIKQAIQSLPAQRKKIYRLSREGGMSIPDIATALGLSSSTVKNTLVSSLQSIREFLRQKGYDVPTVIIALLFF